VTVQELIEALQGIEDKTLRVVVSGYEDGVDDVGYFEEVNIHLNYYDQWYYGRHKQVFSNHNLKDSVIAIQLVGVKTYE
jgi:adenosylcobinamide amidohydrolase